MATTIVIATALLANAASQPSDWPQWRGPQRDGIWRETQTLQDSPSNGLSVLWRAPVAFGFSSPVISGGRVFVTDTRIEKSNAWERVHCLDESTGRIIWTDSQPVRFPSWAFLPGQEKGPIATPIVQGGQCYAVGCFGRVTCFDAKGGKRIWERNVLTEYGADEFTTTDVSPLIEGQLLILIIGCKPGSGVVALDKDSGREVWKALDDAQGYSSPIVIEAGGVRQLIVWMKEGVTSLAPATGKILWREVLPTLRDSIVATPVFDGANRLLISGTMMQLASNRPAASFLWPANKNSPARRILSNTSTPLLDRGFVYSALTSGEFVCLRADTGEQVWKTNTVTTPGNGSSVQLTPNGNSTLLFNDRGELIRARLTPDGYHEISRVQLIAPTTPFGQRRVAWSPPSFANRHVFVRSDTQLICASLEPKR